MKYFVVQVLLFGLGYKSSEEIHIYYIDNITYFL